MRYLFWKPFQVAFLFIVLCEGLIAGDLCSDSWSDNGGTKTGRQTHFDLSIDRYFESPTFRNLYTISELTAGRLASNNLDELKLCLSKLESVKRGLVQSDARFHSLTLSIVLFENAIRAYPQPPPNPAHLRWIDKYVRSKSSRSVLLRLRDANKKLEFKELESDTELSPESLNDVIIQLRAMGLIYVDLKHVSLTELGLKALVTIESSDSPFDDGTN